MTGRDALQDHPGDKAAAAPRRVLGRRIRYLSGEAVGCILY